MNFIEEIRELRMAKENNKLVIFVGAGVSKNSGIPTWGELIKKFTKELHYDKCNNDCIYHRKECPNSDCKYRYSFSQDEYLKIPQYLWNEDESKYWQIINETLNITVESNSIHEIIMRLCPKHIITTNYDKLIENCKYPNSMIYKTIIEDKDLFSNSSNNYIIKMHGDISKQETIVLKESDYLNYEQKHVLIETFIKSLLINHTFLFIGYSLNDYNLKLIMSWVNYFATQNNVDKNRTKNFIIQYNNNATEKYYESYFSKNNIHIINTYDFPQKLKDCYANLKLKNEGKELYMVLDCILNEHNDYLIDSPTNTVFYKYQIFKDQNKVSFDDLVDAYYLGNVEFVCNVLLFNNSSKYNLLKEIILNDNEKANFIKEVLIKAGIKFIQFENNSTEISNKINERYCDKLIYLDQYNNYVNIITQLDKVNDEMAKAYYYHVILDKIYNCKRSYSCLEKVKSNLYKHNNYFRLLLFEFNMANIKGVQTKDNSEELEKFKIIFNDIPEFYKYNCRYLKNIYDGNYNTKMECLRLYNKHKQIYLDPDLILATNKDIYFLKLQAITYNYYYYFKMNYLIIDDYINTKKFFIPYIKGIFCTYTNIKHTNNRIHLNLSRHILNSTDLDIIIKYSNTEDLKKITLNFCIGNIEFEEDVDIIKKFNNLCNSIKMFDQRHFIRYFNNYLYILTKVYIDDSELNAIFKSISNLISLSNKNSRMVILYALDEIFNFIKYYKKRNIEKNNSSTLLSNLLEQEIVGYIYMYNKRRSSKVQGMYKLISTYVDINIQNKVSELLNNIEEKQYKIEVVYYIHSLFNDEQKTLYMKFITESINSVDPCEIFNYLVDGYLEYNQIVENYFYNTLVNCIKNKKNKSGRNLLQDPLTCVLDYLSILYLSGIIKNLDKFKCFSSYSDTLLFLLEPDNFNYSKVDTSNYMWVNIMRNKKYIKILKEHRNEINPDLEKAILNGYADKTQKVLFYKYFLKDEDVNNFL